MTDEEWVQATLAALPAPHMPDEVRARLDAALAAEAPEPADSLVASVPVPQQRRSAGRRMFLGMAGVAAALTLFAVVDPLSLTGLDNSGGTTAEDSALAPTAGAELGEASVAAALIASDTKYTKAGLESQVQTVAAEVTVDDRLVTPAGPTGEPPAFAEGTAADAATACVRAIPDPTGHLVLVDRATFDGQPALVVVLRDGDQFEVVVQGTTCSSADPAILRRVTVAAPPGE